MIPLAKKYDPAHVFGTGCRAARNGLPYAQWFWKKMPCPGNLPFGIPESGKEEGALPEQFTERAF